MIAHLAEAELHRDDALLEQDRRRQGGQRPRLLAVAEQMSVTMYGQYKGDLFPSMIRFAMVTGLRFGELLGLKWADVQDDRIHVVRQLCPDGPALPKHGKLRTVYLTNASRAILDARREVQRSQALVTEWVFARNDGQPINPGTAKDWMSKAMATAGIAFSGNAGADPRWHALRHTFAVRCASEGMPIPMLSELMGHSDIKTTMVYAKFAPSSAALWMARVFDQAAVDAEAASVEPVTLAA